MFSQEGINIGLSGPKKPVEHFNVKVPFRCQLSGFFKPMKIRVVGVVKKPLPKVRDRFEINFEGPDGEIFLHFNPRFDENCVVRNSTRFNGEWQKEERGGGLPLSYEKFFTVDFFVKEGEIRISVDGVYFSDFVLRENMSIISSLSIDGNIDVHCVSAVQDM